MKTFLLSPFYPVADKLDTSHRAGWARYWTRALGEVEVKPTLLTTATMPALDQAKKGDIIYCYHGMEWGGAMNLQSGLTNEIIARADRLVDAKKRGVKLVSLDIPMPSYGKLLEARGYARSEHLTAALAKQGYLRVPNERAAHVIMGDSHALSQYVPGAVIYRTDGQTLHGAMLVGLEKRLENWAFETAVELESLSKLTSYFGNIDIRHHICRLPDPGKAIKDLIDEYGKQLNSIRNSNNISEIEVVLPLHIESEDRVLPKTGWYKGTPFFGTWSERHQVKIAMMTRIKAMAKKHGFAVVDHPKHFLMRNGQLDFAVMETPRSVHIRPSEYRLIQEGMTW
jgi:hypothetical protein